MVEKVFKKQVNRECSFCSCLTPDAEARPDIVEVSSLLSDVMMKYLDVLSTSHVREETGSREKTNPAVLHGG